MQAFILSIDLTKSGTCIYTVFPLFLASFYYLFMPVSTQNHSVTPQKFLIPQFVSRQKKERLPQTCLPRTEHMSFLSVENATYKEIHKRVNGNHFEFQCNVKTERLALIFAFHVSNTEGVVVNLPHTASIYRECRMKTARD